VQSAEGWGEYRADADGFLDRPLPPPGQGVRAVLLGDSFGQGLQVRDRERFSEIAELLMPGLHILNTPRRAARSSIMRCSRSGSRTRSRPTSCSCSWMTTS
jgi:hypothetical protein